MASLLQLLLCEDLETSFGNMTHLPKHLLKLIWKSKRQLEKIVTSSVKLPYDFTDTSFKTNLVVIEWYPAPCMVKKSMPCKEVAHLNL